MALTSDDFICLHKACQEVIEAEAMLDGADQELQIAMLRTGVKTLAVVQRNLIKTILEP